MIRVILVDDHELFREGLRAVFEGELDLAVVGVAGSAWQAQEIIAARGCDLVLVDVSLDGASGIALVRDLRRRNVECRVLMLSMHHHADVVADALDGGAHGYALKSQSTKELFEAIRTVAAGGRYLAPALRETLRAEHDGGAHGLLRALSRREREVFDLLVRGASNGEISRQLVISIKTVETHRAHIMKKLDVHSLGALVRLALRHGHLAA